MKKLILLLFIIVSIKMILNIDNKSLNTIFEEQSIKYNVNYKTIKSICKLESNHKSNVINVNKSIFNIQKGPHYFSNSIIANLYMDYILKPLFLNYDIGICQINSQHLKNLKLDNEELLNEAKNIEVAIKIYSYNLKKCNHNKICALSMYNTGKKNSKIGKIYAKKVLDIEKQYK